MRRLARILAACFVIASGLAAHGAENGPPLPGTKQLTLEGDIASQLVEGADKFHLRELEKSVAQRARHWKRDFSSGQAYADSLAPNRKRLAHILGLRDERRTFEAPEVVAETNQPLVVARGENFD